MIAALEFYIRSIDLRNNLPVPCSFCLESEHGDRKVVTLSEAYRHPDQIAVRHWSLSDCEESQSLPAIQERIIPRGEVFASNAVIVPNYRLLNLVNGIGIPSGLNFRNKPMPADQYTRFYDKLLSMETQFFIKEMWVWREFVRVYLPLMYSLIYSERDEFDRLREIMSMIPTSRPELWHKWLRWKKYMLDMSDIPGEILFYKEYGSVFRFV